MFSQISSRIKNGVVKSSRTNKSLYEFITKQFSFGQRKIAIPRSIETTVDLQISRGPLTSNPELLIDVETASNAESEGSTRDIVPRLQRIKKYIVKENVTYLEVGFRSTDSLNAAKNVFSNVIGIDINPISVEIANHRGHTTFQHNLSSLDEPLQTQNVDAIGCYHVLEHLYNPDEALKKLFQSCSVGAVCQFEVPIQPGEPQIYWGHLFPFEKGDLKQLIIESGFHIICDCQIDGNDSVLCKK